MWLTASGSSDGKATLSGTAPASGGDTVFHLAAENGVDPAATQLFTIEALAITSSASTSFADGASNTFTITTSDTPVNPAISVTKLPAWATLHDNANGTAVLSGTPPVGTTKPVAVTVTAASGKVRATQSLTITPG